MATSLPKSDNISLAVVVGGHAFDAPGFQRVFDAMPGVDAYIQELDNFAADTGRVRDRYDAVLFYNFHQETPEEDGRLRRVLTEIPERGQGIVVLHHAVLAWLEWDWWRDLVGVEDRSFDYHIGERIRVEIADGSHPIAKGMKPWEMTDETYSMASCGEDSQAVFTVDHEKSMKVVGWAREFGNSRVYCLQSGHDQRTYREEGFRAALENGVRWSVGRI